jgi:hypothetical protein
VNEWRGLVVDKCQANYIWSCLRISREYSEFFRSIEEMVSFNPGAIEASRGFTEVCGVDESGMVCSVMRNVEISKYHLHVVEYLKNKTGVKVMGE